MDHRPLTFNYNAESSTLFVSGSVDEVAGPAFRTAVEEHSEGFTRDLTVDLGDVDFLPSLGIGILAVAMRNADERGTKLDLVAVTGTVAQRVLTICGLPHTQR